MTQELIDEMRLSREKNMLADLKMLFEKNGDLEFRDRNGATPVSTLSLCFSHDSINTNGETEQTV